MWRRKTLGLLLAALCPAQHIQFGALVNGGPVANPAIDSAGNLILLTTNLALGICCGTGSRLVLLLNRYGRDGSTRVLADTFMAGTGDTPVFLSVDPQDRIYVGANREGEPALVRFNQDGTRERRELFVPFTRLIGIAFAPNGDPVVVGTSAGPVIQVVRLDAVTLNPVASRLLTGGTGSPRAMTVDSTGAVYIVGSAAARGFRTTPGAFQPGCDDCDWSAAFVTKLSPDLQAVVYSTLIGDRGVSGATAIQVARDGTAFLAGYILGGAGDSPFPTTPGAFQRQLDREPGLWLGRGGLILGPSTGFISRLNTDGTGLIASTLLGGSLSESIDGLALDDRGHVLVHGIAQSQDFPATGVFERPCGPDRGRSYSTRFLTRLDPLLQQVEKSIAAAGIDSQGLPSGPVRGAIFLVLGSSVALADLDRDDASGVACLVSGASYKGLSAVTPGQLVTVFGRGLGPDTLVAFETGAPIPTAFDGTEVLFNGVRAPILAALSSQLNVVAPLGLEPNVWMEIKRNGERIYLRNLRWFTNNPDPMLLVTKTGAAIASPESPYLLLADALNEDGSRNLSGNPAVPGSVVTVFTTGLGALDSSLSEAGYGDGTTRPAQRFIVRTESGRIDDVETVTLPGRSVAVAAVRFRVPEVPRGVLHFSIAPSYASDNFAPGNFIYVGENLP